MVLLHRYWQGQGRRSELDLDFAGDEKEERRKRVEEGRDKVGWGHAGGRVSHPHCIPQMITNVSLNNRPFHTKDTPNDGTVRVVLRIFD